MGSRSGKSSRKSASAPRRKAPGGPLKAGGRHAAPTASAEPRPPKAPRADNHFPIIGIGASAGGLEAMTRLLRALPTENPMTLVLVQHLDPRHESMLVDILSRETPLPVREVRDGMKAEPRHLYVIPPNSSMELVDGSFHVGKRRTATGRPPLPIDDFFTSLAEIQKAASIGVILSGNASDGMLGMRAIKAEGGITFAQDESAQFQGMPRAAISAGAADFVMAPEEIARELERIAQHPFLYVEKGKEQRPDGETLRKIFGMIRSTTGVDFSFYRQTTILRRLARRMAVNKIVSYPEYLTLLKKTPAEVGALFDDFLISVTSFFRDPETFELLQERVIPELLKDRPADQPIRVWVPGCATGEEAYSLAICLLESQDSNRPMDIQIFATDVSDKAIEHARQGVYDDSALHNVSAERLRRFFVKVDGRYQVAKAIRDVCIFARQNVATDPPFSHLDILSCRNLLIYLEPTLQRRLFPLFHHVLKPNGFLVLGPAESAATFGDLFSPIDKRHRVFTKRVSSVRVPPVAILTRQFGEPTRIGGAPQRSREEELPSPDLPREIDRVLLGRYAPPAVVVNSNLEIVHFRGKTGGVLEPPSGAANLNILAMAREGLLPDLRASIHKAKSRDIRVRKEGIRVRANGGYRIVSLEVVPLKSEGQSGRLYLVLFESHEDRKAAPRLEEPASRSDGRRMSAARKEIERLTKELVSTKEYLQAVIEEQESTNEELKSANEEILSSNEELQSTNEELDTAKEELQSANEELTTLNEELQNRNAQLSRANDDLVNLLHSVQIPIVMLGSEGRIRRFTPAAERLLNLIPSDVGRPIQNIRPNLDVPDLPALVLDTVDTITPKQLEIRDREGRWHLMRIQPYRTLDNKIDGAVLSFIDIDAQKSSTLEAEKARDYAEAIVETVPEALLVLDQDFVVRRANSAYYRLFRASAEQTIGRSLFEIGGGHWDVPGLKKRLTENHMQEIEVEKEFDRLGARTMLLRARWARFDADGRSGHVLISIEDVTDRRQAERQLQSSEAQYRGVFESPTEAAILLDAETGEIADVNRFLTEFLGVPREQLVGRKPWELPSVSGAEGLRRWVAGIKGSGPMGDIAISNSQGRALLLELVHKVFLPGERRQLTLTDVTQRRRLEQELRHVQKMDSIGRLAGGMAHDFNNILNIISAYAESLKRGADPARVSEAAGAIAKSVARGAGVVRQLLTFARKDEVAFRAVSVNDLVREATQMVGETFPKNVKVVTDLADGLPDVMADPDQLHQALLNLVVNARDAMPKGGELRLTTRRLEQKEMRELHPEATASSYVRIEVTDTGQGMDEETRSRVFEPFFTTKERGAGSGMGLAVVYGVVAAHRGFVDVESAKDKGTALRLYFPVLAARVDRGARRARRPGPARGGSETILFVEDESELLGSVTELLEQEGYKVITARTGEEALSIYSERHGEISLVVTDVELPEMSGWDAFRKIHDDHPEVRAVLVSGYLDPPMRARMLEGGAKGFLRKPYTLDELLRTMREVLDEEPATTERPQPENAGSSSKAKNGRNAKTGNNRKK